MSVFNSGTTEHTLTSPGNRLAAFAAVCLVNNVFVYEAVHRKVNILGETDKLTRSAE